MAADTYPLSTLEEARDRLVVALDFPSAAPALRLLQLLAHQPAAPRWVKVGLELFFSEGPPLVRRLRERGLAVFLDLKLHDIPNTVAGAIRSLAALDVQMLTLHASGGPAMLRAAVEAAAEQEHGPRLLAVTVLTSMSAAELQKTGVPDAPHEQVLRLAREAFDSGIRGLVASPMEAALLRAEFGSELHLVTPGIRPTQAAAGERAPWEDQQRVARPAAAIKAGASQLVVGRPITRADDPRAAYESILAEIAVALSARENSAKERSSSLSFT